MNNNALFLLGCIPTRILLVVLAHRLDKRRLPYLGAILAVIGLSFLYLYSTQSRLYAPEANGPTWWANLRLLHGMLYLTAAGYALRQQDCTWIPLLVDVIVGFLSFLQYRIFPSK